MISVFKQQLFLAKAFELCATFMSRAANFLCSRLSKNEGVSVKRNGLFKQGVFYSLLVAGGLLIGPLNASSMRLSECGILNVKVKNATSERCLLIQGPQLLHGNLIHHSADIGLLPAGQTSEFSIEQSTMGPDVTFVYRCGTENVVLESQQNFCAARAGAIMGTVLYSSDGLRAVHESVEGSFKPSASGMSSWTIGTTQ